MRKIVPLLLFLLLLTGCSTLPEPVLETGTATQQSIFDHQQQLIQLQSWTFRGKLVVLTPEEKLSGHLQWKQQSDRTNISLSNSLGITMLQAQQTATKARLEVGGNSYEGASLEQMIKQLTRWQFPTSQMQRWAKGLYSPNKASQLAFNPSGQLVSMIESDQFGQLWQLNFSHYTTYENLPPLPGRITLTNDNIKLKLVISRWQA